MLVLRQLIEVVWNLNPISRSEQVEVKNILAAGLVIKPVEDGLTVTDVVNRTEFRSIQEPSTTGPIECDEVPYFCISEAKRNAAAGGAKSSIVRFNISKRVSCPETRTSRNLSDQATLVAKFCRRRSCDNFHALNRAYGKLGGKDFALLIADGLPIDDKAGLRVIAHRVEQTVTIGNNAAGTESNGLAQASARIESGQPRNQASVYVDVSGRINFKRLCGPFYSHSCVGSRKRKRSLDLHGN